MNRYARGFQRLGVFALVSLALAVGGASTAVAASGGATPATEAWLRVGHLAPRAGPVDVWLTPYGGATGSAAVSGVGYGALGSYRTMPPGFYTVAMRPAGAAGTTPAMLTDTVEVTAGSAYTVLAEGVGNPLTLHLTKDDLTPPTAGRARVRVIQASTVGASVDVQAVMGPALVQAGVYGRVTGYSEVPEGRWTLQVTAGASSTSTDVDVRAGSVSTLLVLNAPTGGVTVTAVTDAVGAVAMPKGGVETGGGGLARDGLPAADPTSLRVAGSLGLGLVSSLLVLMVRRRSAVARP